MLLEIKNIPSFNQMLKYPLLVTSDENFLFLISRDDVINIYNPKANSLSCL